MMMIIIIIKATISFICLLNILVFDDALLTLISIDRLIMNNERNVTSLEGNGTGTFQALFQHIL
jgi:hypothetical protein